MQVVISSWHYLSWLCRIIKKIKEKKISFRLIINFTNCSIIKKYVQLLLKEMSAVNQCISDLNVYKTSTWLLMNVQFSISNS